MKTLYVDYCDIPNMGDLLNRYMLEDLFGIKVVQSDHKNVDLFAIGSSLSHILLDQAMGRRFILHNLWVKYGTGHRPLSKPLYVWGTGFLSDVEYRRLGLVYANTIFLSLRGQLSKERIERITGRKMNIPLGDGGLLAERWIGPVEKKHQIGIIPHYHEQDAPVLGYLDKCYDDYVLINLRDDPADVVKQIASCRYILSSSLHGLIVADSYHVPNCHIKLYEFGEKLHGDGFKFKDYYSAYGLTDNPVFVKSPADFPTLEEIENRYMIQSSEVELKKEALYNALKNVIESGRF